MSLPRLPNELLLLIVGYLDEIGDIRALVLTSVELKDRVLSHLYQLDAKSTRRALFWAIGCKDPNLALGVLEGSLNAGANPNLPDKYLFTPLIKGITCNSVSVVERLLQCQDIDVNRQSEKYFRTPLIAAAQLGRVKLVELLLARNDILVNIADPYLGTALCYAVTEQEDQTAALLLARNDVDPNVADYLGRSPLIEAICSGNLPIALLLLAREDINLNDDRSGSTALIWAINFNRQEIAERLLRKEKIRVDIEDCERTTALVAAVENAQVRIVELILTKIQDDGRDLGRALHGALRCEKDLYLEARGVRYRTFDFVPFRKPQKHLITQLILKHPAADPNYQDHLGYTPIFIAADGYERGVELLIEAGANVIEYTAVSENRCTPMDYMRRSALETGVPPLMKAIKEGHVRIVELLLNAGASPTQLIYGNLTPLSLATTCGHEDIVRLLLQSGATWVGTDQVAERDEDNTYYTPLEWAVAFGYERIIEILLHSIKETSRPVTQISVIDEEQAYRRAVAIAKRLGYKFIHEMLLRERFEKWNASTTIDQEDPRVEKILSQVPHHTLQKDIKHLVKRLREKTLMEIIICNDPTFEATFYGYLASIKLSRYQILAYASGSFKCRWNTDKHLLVAIRKPYLCMMVSAADNPGKLVRELEKVPYIGAYAATFQGEIIAGSWTEPVPIARRFDGSAFISLSPYRTTQRLDEVILVDVYVRRWDLNVNLAAIVEEAAKNCNYFGRFVYDGDRLRVERTDPNDQPWEGPCTPKVEEPLDVEARAVTGVQSDE